MNRNGPGLPWTEDELRILREHYPIGGVPVCMPLLPRRTRDAITRRAFVAGLCRKQHWTALELGGLRDLLAENVPAEEIARRIGRPATAIAKKAREIHVAGCPGGYEPLTHAARRSGYQIKSLHVILAWAGVPVTKVPSVVGRGHRRIVVPQDVDAAVAAWVSRDSVGRAARRFGVSEDKLRRRLIRVGVDKGRARWKHWRVTDDEVRAALEAPMPHGRWNRRLA